MVDHHDSPMSILYFVLTGTLPQAQHQCCLSPSHLSQEATLHTTQDVATMMYHICCAQTTLQLLPEMVLAEDTEPIARYHHISKWQAYAQRPNQRGCQCPLYKQGQRVLPALKQAGMATTTWATGLRSQAQRRRANLTPQQCTSCLLHEHASADAVWPVRFLCL